MKWLKFIAAFILTVAMLYIARTSSRGEPEEYVQTVNGYSFDYLSVPKALEDSTVALPVSIEGKLDENARPVFRISLAGHDHSDLSGYATSPMIQSDSAYDIYYTNVTAGKRGGRFYYYFEIADSLGHPIATFTEKPGQAFLFKYIGHVPPLVLIGHILLIFATFYFVVLATLDSLLVITKRSEAQAMMKRIFWATACAFVGGYPFGFAMNWYAFDGFWEGVPFGTDATDNKTQLLFVYLVFVVLSGLYSLTGNSKFRDIYSNRTLGWIGLGAFVIMLAIYLIPHSIQFSAALTYGVCYSFIGLFALLWIIGFVRTRSSSGKSRERSVS